MIKAANWPPFLLGLSKMKQEIAILQINQQTFE